MNAARDIDMAVPSVRDTPVLCQND